MSNLCPRVTGTVAVPFRSLRFKDLCGNGTGIDKRVANHQACDLFVSSLNIIKKTETLNLMCYLCEK